MRDRTKLYYQLSQWLSTNRKSLAGFRLVQKSVTLNGVNLPSTHAISAVAELLVSNTRKDSTLALTLQ